MKENYLDLVEKELLSSDLQKKIEASTSKPLMSSTSNYFDQANNIRNFLHAQDDLKNSLEDYGNRLERIATKISALLFFGSAGAVIAGIYGAITFTFFGRYIAKKSLNELKNKIETNQDNLIKTYIELTRSFEYDTYLLENFTKDMEKLKLITVDN